VKRLATFIAGIALLLSIVYVSPAVAVGEMPDKQTCASAKSGIVAGGCIATDREKGNCVACHSFTGIEHTHLQAGNIGPPLVAMKARYPSQKRLREQVFDASRFNPHTVMPLFGKYRILTDKEIDLIVQWLYSL
jgi:sulfur-oxidizing protein SoxX